jgi:hypothetical protein
MTTRGWRFINCAGTLQRDGSGSFFHYPSNELDITQTGANLLENGIIGKLPA